jgi:hypothetical protein
VGKYDYVSARTLDEAKQIIEQEYGEGGLGKVDNLVIRTHGTAQGYINNEQGNGIVPGEISKDGEALAYFRGLLSKNANVLFTACGVGANKKNSRDLAKYFINKNEGRSVFINKTSSLGLMGTNDDHPEKSLVYFRFNRVLPKYKDGGFKWYIYSKEEGTHLKKRAFYDVHISGNGGFGISENKDPIATFPSNL